MGRAWLTFKNNKRKFSTFGEPTVSLDAHAAVHKREAARKEEQEGHAARLNALPGVRSVSTPRSRRTGHVRLRLAMLAHLEDLPGLGIGEIDRNAKAAATRRLRGRARTRRRRRSIRLA